MNNNELKERLALLRTANPISKENILLKEIFSIKKGSLLKIDKKEHIVKDVFTYQEEDGFSWNEYQLENILTGERIYMEVEEDDEIDIYLSVKSLSKEDLYPLYAEDIEKMCEDEEGKIEYEGRTYFYSSYEELKFIGKNKEDEYLNSIEFKTKDRKFFLNIEVWDDSEDLFISEKINNGRIEIISI